jgi:hypothetical protein
MQAIERQILIALLKDMRAAGYQPAAVWDGEQYVIARSDGDVMSIDSKAGSGYERIARPLTDREALEAIDSVCDSTLHFTHHNAETWGNRGVLLILGNGEDVISDSHDAKDEPFGEIIDAVCRRIGRTS